MMTKPTMSELMKKIENRYALVVATAKRARQIAAGDEKLVECDDVAPVTVAAKEIEEEKVTLAE